MAKEISKRCGVGRTCEHYDPNNAQSGCKIYTNRAECSKSMRNRYKVAKNARKKAKEPKGYNFNRPMWAQELGDEWDDYCWSADDF